MAQLILKFKDLVLKEFDLEGGGVTIGREPDNDIIVENLLVSGYHARVDAAGKDIILTDLQSKNGTFLNGERTTSAKLNNGDEILVGKHTIVLVLDPQEVEEKQQLSEATMFMDVAQASVEPATPAAKPETEPPAAEPELKEAAETVEPRAPAAPVKAETETIAPAMDRQALLSFVAGGSEEFEITKKLVKLGKGEEADIHVGGLLTPKVAATISKRATGYHLTPMGRAKVKVNGNPVKGSYRLKEFDTIEVGPVRVQFYYKS
jgi:pSer/pThr/pTyr-binding forkhead associated (FHA) protein